MTGKKDFALITGASSGIGEIFARKIAERGYDLILTARREDRLKFLAEELEKQHNTTSIIVVADLATQEGIKKVEEELVKHENLYFLINNAGFATIGSFENLPWYKHQNMLSVHINAPTQLTHAALPIMIKNNLGVIINVASMAAFIRRKNLYRLTKEYLVNFTKLLKERLKNTNIVVQALCPGFTYSEFHQTEEFKGMDAYSRVPKFAWMTSEKVVEISLKAIRKRKTIVITGFRNKIGVKLINWRIIRYR